MTSSPGDDFTATRSLAAVSIWLTIENSMYCSIDRSIFTLNHPIGNWQSDTVCENLILCVDFCVWFVMLLCFGTGSANLLILSTYLNSVLMLSYYSLNFQISQLFFNSEKVFNLTKNMQVLHSESESFIFWLAHIKQQHYTLSSRSAKVHWSRL